MQFMSSIGFLTVGTTDVEFLTELTTALSGFVEMVERNTPVSLSLCSHTR